MLLCSSCIHWHYTNNVRFYFVLVFFSHLMHCIWIWFVCLSNRKQENRFQNVTEAVKSFRHQALRPPACQPDATQNETFYFNLWAQLYKVTHPSNRPTKTKINYHQFNSTQFRAIQAIIKNVKHFIESSVNSIRVAYPKRKLCTVHLERSSFIAT